MPDQLKQLARDEPDAFKSVISKADDPLKSWLEDIFADAEVPE